MNVRWIYRTTKWGWGGWVLHSAIEGGGTLPLIPGCIRDPVEAHVWWGPVLTQGQSHGYSEGATTVLVTREDGVHECPLSVLLEKTDGSG